MAKKNDLLSRYMRFLRGCIDLHDWGTRDSDGTPKRQRTNEQIWEAIDGLRKPFSFGRAAAERHLAEQETHYYVSGRRADTALLMIDVDAHEGQSDALDAVTLLAAGPFAGQYFEQSTRDRGYHLYVRVRCDGYRSVFNARTVALTNALTRLLVDHNVESTVEVKGTCTLLDYATYTPEEFASTASGGHVDPTVGSWKRARKLVDARGEPYFLVPCGVRSRGTLAKMPRLTTGSPEEAMTRLEQAHVLTEQSLREIVSDADMIADWDAASRFERVVAKGRDEIMAGLNLRASEPFVQEQHGRGRMRSGRAIYNHTGCVSEQVSDAFVRTRLAAFRLAGLLGRGPTAEELHEFYVAENYATGSSSPRRWNRMREVAGFVAGVFDPNWARPGFEARVDDLVRAVQEHVRPEHREGLKYDYALPDRDLAMLLYLVERGSFDGSQPPLLLWTLPQASAVAFAERLKADGSKCGGWANQNKFVAAKQVLERASLIHGFDEKFRYGGKGHGVAKRFHVGPNHPLYRDFVAYCDVSQPQVLRTTGDRVFVSRPYDGHTTEVVVELPASVTVAQVKPQTVAA